MKLSRVEVLRRTVAAAHRAAGVAHTAAFRARKKMDEAHEAAKALVEQGSPSQPIKSFIAAESERLRVQSLALENAAWDPWRELGDLADLMGAKDKEA